MKQLEVQIEHLATKRKHKLYNTATRIAYLLSLRKTIQNDQHLRQRVVILFRPTYTDLLSNSVEESVQSPQISPVS